MPIPRTQPEALAARSSSACSRTSRQLAVPIRANAAGLPPLGPAPSRHDAGEPIVRAITGIAEASVEALGADRYVAVGGQRIRVNVRRGVGVPLVLCNGVGASLEVLDPLVAQLHPDCTVVRFDVPGTGGSPTSVAPYGIPHLAWGAGPGSVQAGDGRSRCVGIVLGGGALAQQFALQKPTSMPPPGAGGDGHRCAESMPGRPRVLAKMLTPRRFSDPEYAASIAAKLTAGTVETHGDDVARLFVRQLHAGSKVGYLHQLLAGALWTSVFALPGLRQQTLIVAGTNDTDHPGGRTRTS